MTTDSFRDFLEKQEFNRAEQKRLADAVEKLTADVASIHASRHSVQENLSQVIAEMRTDHNTLEEQVSKLVASMRELVIAMEGSYGSKGLIGRIENIETAMKNLHEINSDIIRFKAGIKFALWVFGIIQATALVILNNYLK